MNIWKLSIAAVFTVSALFAHDEIKGKPVNIKATVVDTGCYFVHGEVEKGHAACAAMCAKAGIPLALVDESGKLYLVLGNDHKNPNTKLMPFIEKKVKVSGTLVEKGGMSGISIKTIEAE
jgi:CO dehydrogenase/acetyl-CoA synthase alpha subunit